MSVTDKDIIVAQTISHPLQAWQLDPWEGGGGGGGGTYPDALIILFGCVLNRIEDASHVHIIVQTVSTFP